MTVTYEKAVRDKIPEIIEKSGKRCVVQKLADEDFLPELEKKLNEELEEYYSSNSIEELADIVEVIFRILELKNVNKNDFDILRLEKLKNRGGFNNNYFLLEVKD